MWIEWENKLINLDYVKNVFIRKDFYTGNFWKLEISFEKDEDQYVRYFDNQQEAKECFDQLKKKILYPGTFNFGMPC